MLDLVYSDKQSGQPIDLNELRSRLESDVVPEVWIACGQSNMAGGAGSVQYLTRDNIQPGFFLVDHAGKVRPARHPFHRTNAADGNTADYNLNHQQTPAAEFARYRALYGGARKIILCGGAVGGSSMVGANGDWYGPNTTGQADSAGGAYYQDVLQRMTDLVNDNDVWLRGILWHQGEADAGGGTTKSLYKEAFLNMVNGWKNNIPDDYYGDHSNIQVLIGQLAPKLLEDGYGPETVVTVPASDYQRIDEAHRELAAQNRGFSLVSSAGLTLADQGNNPPNSNIHFDAASYTELGRRYFAVSFEAMQESARGSKFSYGVVDHDSNVEYSEGQLVSASDRLWRAPSTVEAGAHTPTQWDNLSNGLHYKGSWDPRAESPDEFPSGASKGDFYVCSQQTTLGSEPGGQEFLANDILIALVDNPAVDTFSANWARIQNANLSSYFRVFPSGYSGSQAYGDNLVLPGSQISGYIQSIGLSSGGKATTLQSAAVLDGLGFAYGAAVRGGVGFQQKASAVGTSDTTQLAVLYLPDQTQAFNGNGSTTAFTVTDFVLPTSTGNVRAFIGGVQQTAGTDYSISGQVVTFTSPPASGTGNVTVTYGVQEVGGFGLQGTSARFGNILVTPYGATCAVNESGAIYGLQTLWRANNASDKTSVANLRGRDVTNLYAERRGVSSSAGIKLDHEGVIEFYESTSAGFASATKRAVIDVNGLEILGSGKAIKLYSPNGTAYNVTVNNAGSLQVTAA